MNLPNAVENPGSEKYSLAKVFGEALRNEMRAHDDFYFFSPDETTSNRLAAVYETTDRAWTRKTEPWDKNLTVDYLRDKYKKGGN